MKHFNIQYYFLYILISKTTLHFIKYHKLPSKILSKNHEQFAYIEFKLEIWSNISINEHTV